MKIGIIGATGAVGRQMIDCLDEQAIPVEELRLFASSRSVGRTMKFKQKDVAIEAVSQDRLNGLDAVFGAVSAELAKEYRPLIQKAGALFIDNSSAFRAEEDVPLVIPEINGADAFAHHGVIANPNCSTIVALMAAAPIANISPIEKMIVSTYQAVSGAGIPGLRELHDQIHSIEEGKPVETEVFPAQIAYNCIPFIGSEGTDGYTSEEAKMQNEGRKILHLPELRVTCTCVRVPVFRSHSVSVSLQCKEPVSIEAAEQALRLYLGIRYMKEGYPMPLDTSDQDLVYVGRLREDKVFDGGLALFACGDQIRKGAASNAVQILRVLLSKE